MKLYNDNMDKQNTSATIKAEKDNVADGAKAPD